MRGFALEIFKRRGGHSLGRCAGWKLCIMLLLILSVVAGVSVVGSVFIDADFGSNRRLRGVGKSRAAFRFGLAITCIPVFS